MDEEQQLFLEEVMENYKNPKNFKKLENYTTKQHQKNTSCGDSFDLYIKFEDNNINNKIEDIGFDGEGCAISTASFSMLTEKIKKLDSNQIKNLTDKDIFSMLGIKIGPGKINCALLSLKALQNSLNQLENN